MFESKSFYYSIVNSIAKQCNIFYYNRFAKIGKDNIPKNAALFFAANHQNSLIDPCIIGSCSDIPVHFLANAGVFKNNKVAKILYSLNMIPIYRERDGRNFKDNNISTFDKSNEILLNGGRIVIFPEGSHDYHKIIRPMKKGIGRILYISINQNPNKQYYIIPTGMYYSNTYNMNADMVINYGKAINVNEIFNNNNDEKEFYNNISNILYNSLLDTTINFLYSEFYDLYNFYLIKDYKKEDKLEIEYINKKNLNNKINSWIERNDTNQDKLVEYNSKAKEIIQFAFQNKIKVHFFKKLQNINVVKDIIVLTILFPIFIYGALNSFIPFNLPKIILKKVKDRQYDSSISQLTGVMFFWFFWLIQTLIVLAIFDNYIWIYYLLSLFVSAYISLKYLKYYRLFIKKNKYNKLLNNNYSAIENLHHNYNEINNVKEDYIM